jgi:hypothetical protein
MTPFIRLAQIVTKPSIRLALMTPFIRLAQIVMKPSIRLTQMAPETRLDRARRHPLLPASRGTSGATKGAKMWRRLGGVVVGKGLAFSSQGGFGTFMWDGRG